MRQTANLIFQHIYRNMEKGVTRQELALQLDMSLPTIGTHLKLLAEQGLIVEITEEKSRRTGRRSNLIYPNPACRYSVGLEVRKDSVKFLLMDFRQHVLDRFTRSFDFTDQEALPGFLAGTIEELLEAHYIPRDRVLGVGTAITAIVTKDVPPLIHAYILNIDRWQQERITRAIPYPCTLRQIAAAALFANLQQVPEKDSLTYVWIGEVLAAATAFQRGVYWGDHSLCMEINHFCMVPGGRLHNCGKRGCLGAYCSADQLSEGPYGSLDRFFAALEAGEPAAVVRWEQYTDILAQALNNLYLVVDCAIVLGGPVGSRLTPFLGGLQRKASAFNPNDNATGYLQVDTCDDSAILGAAQDVIHQYVFSGQAAADED